jgi:F-type H+-transporting ATPase subunit epsilon
MRLKVVTPMAVCVDQSVRRITAEAPDGHFGMLPNHADFVCELVPGILRYETEDGVERFVGVYSGTLVKCGDEVCVAVGGAVAGDALPEVRARVETDVRRRNEDEREARAALARLEVSMIRRFRDLRTSGS